MNKKLLILTTSLALAPPAALGQGEVETQFDVDLSAGVEFDSNVSVQEIESNTGADDVATRFRAEFDFEAKWQNETELKLGYTFSDKSFDEFSDFDLQTHLANATLQRDFGDFTTGATYRYLDAKLGGDDYLTMHQITPHISGFVAKDVFIRADYVYSDKTFDNRADRDSTVHNVGADVYYFLDGSRRYLTVGIDAETNDATDDAFDFDAIGLRARLTQRVDIAGRDLQLRLGWRYEDRDYSGETPSIGAPRNDERHRIQASAEYPIHDRLYVAAEYEYGDFSSNLPSADYSQNVFGLRLGVRF